MGHPMTAGSIDRLDAGAEGREPVPGPSGEALAFVRFAIVRDRAGVVPAPFDPARRG